MKTPLTIATTIAIASSFALHGATSARTVLDLNGEWHVIVDPQECGFYDYRMMETAHFGRNEKPRSKTDLVEYSFDAAPTLKVPGDWNSQREDLFWYEGVVWYEKEFEFRQDLSTRQFLVFDAVNYEANVYVNGKNVGKHQGGFSPFEFEVTDLLKDGSNFVVVKVDNRRHREAIPTLAFDWWNYGGITRDVRLETRPSVYVDDWNIVIARPPSQASSPESVELVANVHLDKAIAGIPVRVEIPEAGLLAEGVTDEKGSASFPLDRSPLTLWSPDNPKLYEVKVTAGEDVCRDEMGFRTIETRGREILLNGKPVFLRGACVHDESFGHRVTTEEDVAENIRRAKELGCNFLRLAHYPHNEKMVRACEREGIMVWSEIPLYWMIAWESTNTYALAEQQVREMIRRDIRRGNVVVWSLANETVQTAQRTDFLKRLAAYARSLDSSRLISLAMEITSAENCVNRLRDALNDVVDIVAFNEYVGWYRNVADADKMVWDIPYEKPIVVSEFGGSAVAGRHGEAYERWTEEMQEEIYKANLRMFDRIEGLAGIAPWVLSDFRSPRRLLDGVQDRYNRKGLFAPDGTKKKAFYVLRDFYRRESVKADEHKAEQKGKEK